MKYLISMAFRAGLAAAVLWRVYPETGPWTVLWLALGYAGAEAATWWVLKVSELIAAIADLQPDLDALLKIGGSE